MNTSIKQEYARRCMELYKSRVQSKKREVCKEMEVFQQGARTPVNTIFFYDDENTITVIWNKGEYRDEHGSLIWKVDNGNICQKFYNLDAELVSKLYAAIDYPLGTLSHVVLNEVVGVHPSRTIEDWAL